MATLGDVTTGKVAQQEPAGAGDFRYIDIGSLDNARKCITEAKALPVAKAPSRARQLVVAGDVLVSMTRPNLNAIAVVPPELAGATASTGFDVLRANEAALPQWLFLTVRSRAFVEAMTVLVQGALYPAVRPADIRAFPLALPPVAEQRRIVARLEVLEARSRRARAEIDALPPLLAQARQSLLSAAFRGNLTAGWRAHQRNNVPCRDCTVGDVVESVKYGTSVKCDYAKVGIPVLRIPNIEVGFITTMDLKFGELDKREAESLRLSTGDVLVIRSNGSVTLVGRAAIVAKEQEGFAYAGYLIRLRVRHDLIEPAFLTNVFNGPLLRAQIEAAAHSTTGVNNINSDELRGLRLRLPPLAEQREIVRRLESAFARLDAAVAAHTAAVAELDRLDASLLAKAFRGELVPQDPADEPAAITLQRLRTPREIFDPFAYLFQFIPALLRASEGTLPFARTLEGCALLRVARDLVRLLEPLGGAAARQHFERFAQSLKDGSFEPVLQKLIAAGAITHDPRAGHTLRLVEAKAPPIAALIAEDARHVASVLALVPTEALETVAPAQTRKLCAKSPAAVFATA